jgi:hypothetical protein
MCGATLILANSSLTQSLSGDAAVVISRRLSVEATVYRSRDSIEVTRVGSCGGQENLAGARGQEARRKFTDHVL